MTQLLKACLSSTFFALFFCTQLVAAGFVPLKDFRSQLVFPSYSDEEKEFIVNQALVMAREMYVHRELKNKSFGDANDAVTRLEALLEVSKQLSPEALNLSISQIFRDQRDLHLNYMYPYPLSCHAVLVPIAFGDYESAGQQSVHVTKTIRTGGLVDTSSIAVGDKLISYNGLTVNDALAKLETLGSGANPSAARSRAIEALSFHSLKIKPAPLEDRLALTFERPNGSRYHVEIPWLAIDRCQGVAPKRNVINPIDSKAQDPLHWQMAEDDEQQLYNRYFGRYDLSEKPIRKRNLWVDPVQSSAEPVLKWTIVNTVSGRFGFIRLSSFVPERLSIEGTLAETQRIMEQEFNGLDGLIFDVRDNGGGNITLAERLLQFFTPQNILPSNTRLLSSALNEQVFTTANLGETNAWLEGLRDAMQQGNTYSRPLTITSTPSANQLGQIWFKPVVVLTNSNCYSACDMFAAGMQDHGAATIIGHQATTGAGGANVMEHSFFAKLFEKDPDAKLKAMPYGHDMRVSWRQTVRRTKNEGRILEGEGVLSDITIPAKLSDLFHNEADFLESLGKIIKPQQNNFASNIQLRSDGQPMFENGVAAEWSEYVVGTDTVEVIFNSQAIARLSPDPSGKLDISLSELNDVWSKTRVELIGRANGKRAWRVWRDLRWIGNYIPVDDTAPFALTFDNKTALQFENIDSSELQGWQIRDNKLRIGRGKTYGPNVQTLAYIPLNLSNLSEGEMTVDLSLDSETDYDVLTIYGRIPGKQDRVELKSLSGKLGAIQEKIDLSQLIGLEKVDIVFEFSSDSNLNSEGPIINSVEIKPAALVSTSALAP